MNFEYYDITEGFDQIAPGYDRANDAMTLGMHRRWRRRLCKAAARRAPAGAKMLDVATGTADVLIKMLALRSDVQAIGVDPSRNMLAVAERKLQEQPEEVRRQIRLRHGDCRQLPFASESFDVVTISWGIRNVRPFEQGLREIRRVLRVNGSLVALEGGQPESTLVRAGYSLYKRALPWIGSLVAGYRPAYDYYRDSVDEFPCGPAFTQAMQEAGFEQTHYRALLGGIAYLYEAVRPDDHNGSPTEAEPPSKLLVGQFGGRPHVVEDSPKAYRLAA